MALIAPPANQPRLLIQVNADAAISGKMSIYMMPDDVVGIIRRSRRFLQDCPAIAGRTDRVGGAFLLKPANSTSAPQHGIRCLCFVQQHRMLAHDVLLSGLQRLLALPCHRL